MPDQTIITHLLEDDGMIPNNADLPLIVYSGILIGESAEAVQQRIRSNDWQGTWINGVYSYHHFHSTAHEVLGCFQGSAIVQFGGASGPKVSIGAGDGVVIPAGVGHKRISASSDFRVVGGYPPGQVVDMCDGCEASRDHVLDRIQNLPKPETDPFFGKEGPLINLWC